MSQSNGNAPKFGTRKNVKMIGRTDVAGGGQVVVENGYAFVGHMDPPHGTTILDVKDPKHPKVIAEIEIPHGVHSHKVRVSGDIMLVNLERYRSKEKQPTGLKVYDIANREKPREIAFFQTNGGVHRFTFDGRYAYISAHIEGYIGRIPMILDLKDPAHPEEVGRWWMPGQWIGGGETPSWEGTAHQCHHPIRRGDRLYTSYWHGGFVILDIADMSRPKYISGLNWSPPYPSPIHTTLPIPWKLMNRDVMVVSDEEAGKLAPCRMHLCGWSTSRTKAGRCRSRRSIRRKPLASNRAINTARTNPPSKSMTTKCSSPGSAAACASSTSVILTSRPRSVTTSRPRPRTKDGQE